MITEKDNQLIANDVYKVDSKKVNEPFQQGDLVANDKYIIIEKPFDNLENGMQAMAVAPVVNGEVDKSRNVSTKNSYYSMRFVVSNKYKKAPN